VVGLDEAHASHISCQVEYVVTALADLLAVVKEPEVHQVELVAELVLLQRSIASARRSFIRQLLVIA
jgi:hypothetical protein